MKSKNYLPKVTNYEGGFDVEKKDWIKMRPGKYVYHLTPSHPIEKEYDVYYYKRLSIVLEGLHGSDKGLRGVWANNQLENIFRLYPMTIDAIGMDNIDLLHWIYSHDVWRIDTTAFNATWYIDPNFMLTEGEYIREYVFTESSVPPHALKLYRFNLDEYNFLYVNRLKLNFSLDPVKEVNELLNHQRYRKRCLI